MLLTKKLEELEKAIEAEIKRKLKLKGVKSQFSEEVVLRVKDEDMIRLNYDSRLVELYNNGLIDSLGYNYYLNHISLLELCRIIDNI